MRLLVRLGQDTRIGEPEMRAFIREGFLRPGAGDDFEDLGETLAAFGVRYAVVLVGPREATPADTENQSTAADLVHGGGFLGELERVAQGQDLHGCADFDVAGGGGGAAGGLLRGRGGAR